MKYASEVLGIMRPYPGKEFRIGQLVKQVAGREKVSPPEVEAMRKGIRRVLDDLIEIGYVERAGRNTNSVSYVWRGHPKSATSSHCFMGRHLGQ